MVIINANVIILSGPLTLRKRAKKGNVKQFFKLSVFMIGIADSLDKQDPDQKIRCYLCDIHLHTRDHGGHPVQDKDNYWNFPCNKDKLYRSDYTLVDDNSA